jgi:hypothetical protein
MGKAILLVTLLVMVATAPASASGKPPKPPGAVILVSPLAVRAHNLLSIRGVGFPANIRMQVQMFCPIFGEKAHGYARWSVHVGRDGTFVQKRRMPEPVQARSTRCNLYALVLTSKKGYYVSVGFTLRQ